MNLAIFVWSTNEECACSKFKSLCCVDNFLFCTHALFTVGDSNFARLTQTAVGTGWMPQCGRGCQCAHAQALAPRTELKCMAKYRYWLAVEDRTILCLLCWLMKAIVVSLCTKKLTTAVGFHSVFWSYQNALLKTWRA